MWLKRYKVTGDDSVHIDLSNLHYFSHFLFLFFFFFKFNLFKSSTVEERSDSRISPSTDSESACHASSLAFLIKDSGKLVQRTHSLYSQTRCPWMWLTYVEVSPSQCCTNIAYTAKPSGLRIMLKLVQANLYKYSLYYKSPCTWMWLTYTEVSPSQCGTNIAYTTKAPVLGCDL